MSEENSREERLPGAAAAGAGISPDGPRSVPAGHGLDWIKEGFGLFRQAPWTWIVMILLLVGFGYLLGKVPAGSLVLSLISPVITAGIMLGCKALDTGAELRLAHLVAGFQQRTGTLVAAGALYIGLGIAVVILMVVIGLLLGVELPQAPSEGQPVPVIDLMLLVLLLIAATLFVPVAMAYYFAPALIVFHHQLGVVEAFRLSFRGCLRNMMPFLVYGLVVLALSLLAVIPFMLGLLVLMPVLAASVYVAYKDIFPDRET